MTYTPNKPDQGPSPAVDAVTIKNNFASFGAAFSTNTGGNTFNHTAINNRFQGKHETVVMELQANDPGVNLDLAVLYNKNATTISGTQPQLYVQIPQFLPTGFDSTISPNTPMLLTYQSVNTSGPMYQSFLPGGYILYFGSAGFGALTITLSPTPSLILMAIATSNNIIGGNPALVNTVILSPTSFQILTNAGIGSTFGWFAIAKG